MSEPKVPQPVLEQAQEAARMKTTTTNCKTNHFDVQAGACPRCGKLILRDDLGREIDPPENRKKDERITFSWREDQNPEVDPPMRARWANSGDDVNSVWWFEHVKFETQSAPHVLTDGTIEFSYVAEDL